THPWGLGRGIHAAYARPTAPHTTSSNLSPALRPRARHAASLDRHPRLSCLGRSSAVRGRAPGEPQRQSVRRRVVRGDAPKRRAGGPERAAFAARDGAWQEADGAPPLTTRRRYREAPMAARASGPNTAGGPQANRPPGQATSQPATPPRSPKAARAGGLTTAGIRQMGQKEKPAALQQLRAFRSLPHVGSAGIVRRPGGPMHVAAHHSGRIQSNSQVARPRKLPRLTTSVIAERKIADAVAGSAPRR